MATSDTNLPQLIIHELTKEEYEALTPEPNQLYLTPDESLTEGDLKTVNGNSIVGSGNIGVGTVTSVNNVSPVNGNVTLNIPSAVTESTVSGWGFTKNTGTVTSVNNVTPVNGNVTLSIPAAQVQADWDVTDTTSKAFIKNKPYIPSGVVVDQTYDATSTNAQSGVAINGAGFLQNTATENTSLTIFGVPTSYTYATNVGYLSEASAFSSVSLGDSARAREQQTIAIGARALATNISGSALGFETKAQGDYSTAIGASAITNALYAIQIGDGTNSTASTLSVGFGTSKNYTLLDGTTGLIPDARISSNIARTSAVPTESTVSGWGFTKNTGTVTSVNNVSPVNGNVTLSIPAAQVNSDWNATSGKAEILNKPNLATVATSGSYNDLTNKPTIPDTSNLANKDLSNLSNTGENKFQAPLVSGTNIKTINSTPLLGNGNINVADTSLSNLNSTGQNIVNTTLDQNTNTRLKYWTGTQAQYDAITTKDSNTIYNVEDTTSPVIGILDSLYPIGSIYIGTMSACPLATLGIGTWQLVASDRVLQGAGTRGSAKTTLAAGLPSMTTNTTGNHTHTRGSMNITGQISAFICEKENAGHYNADATGAFTATIYDTSASSQGSGNNSVSIGFDASRSWTGETSENGNHSHTVNTGVEVSTTVQPPAYIVNIWERVA